MALVVSGSLALLAADFLSSLGIVATAAEVTSTIGLGETVGSLIGGAVISKAGDTVNTAVKEVLHAAIDKVVPQETQKTFNEIFNKVNKTFKAYKTGPGTLELEYKNHFLETQSKNIPSLNRNQLKYVDPDVILPYGGLIPQDDGIQAVSDSKNNLVGCGTTMAGSNSNKQDFTSDQLASFLVKYSTEFATTGDPVKALTDMIEKNPGSVDLISRLNNFISMKSLPQTEEFKKIQAIYTGIGFGPSSFSIRTNPDTKLIEVSGRNELGEVQTLPQTVGLILPSVPGTIFMGAKSINNALPNFDRYEDMCSFFHDYGYARGFADRKADLEYISRMAQGLQRGDVKTENRNLVRSTIIYFANISLLLGRLKGEKTITDFASAPVDSLAKDDIYPIMVPSSLTLTPEEYKRSRYQFYNQFEKDLEQQSRSSSLLAQIGGSNINKYWAEEFGNLEIQII